MGLILNACFGSRVRFAGATPPADAREAALKARGPMHPRAFSSWWSIVFEGLPDGVTEGVCGSSNSKTFAYLIRPSWSRIGSSPRSIGLDGNCAHWLPFFWWMPTPLMTSPTSNWKSG